MLKERDMLLDPEPILEDLGWIGTKYNAFLKINRSDQSKRLVKKAFLARSLLSLGKAKLRAYVKSRIAFID